METKVHGGKAALGDLSNIPGGEEIRLCIQCGTCTASCPNANKMDYAPRQIIAMARAGMLDEVLSSNSMWYCASCFFAQCAVPGDLNPLK